MTRIFVIPMLFILCSGCGSSQQPKQEVPQGKPENTDYAYQFSAPDSWGKEQIHFPIEFAPAIDHEGVEEIRFAPGWSDAASEGYWSYCFLWWLKGKPVIDTATIRKDIEAYYTGLVGRNIKERLIPKEKQVPVAVTVTEIQKETNDRATYAGKVKMLDYMKQVPITLNAKIHVQDCEKENHTAIFFSLSPKEFKNSIWKDFNEIHQSIRCRE